MHIKHLKWLLLALSIGLLASCAPAAKGSSSYRAFDLSEDATIRVTPGSRWYFTDNRPAPYFDVDLADIPNSAFEKSTVGREYVRPVTLKFSVESAVLPDNWAVDLESVQGIQTVTKREGTDRVSVWWRESVRFAFAVDIPADTQPGEQTAIVTVKASNGTSGLFLIPITVEPIMASN